MQEMVKWAGILNRYPLGFSQSKNVFYMIFDPRFMQM